MRLHIAEFDVPDEFVLLLSGDGVVRESKYKVVWRRGHEVGAEFVCVVRSGFALHAVRTAANFAKLPELLRRGFKPAGYHHHGSTVTTLSGRSRS